jgi:hypothetical protein
MWVWQVFLADGVKGNVTAERFIVILSAAKNDNNPSVRQELLPHQATSEKRFVAYRDRPSNSQNPPHGVRQAVDFLGRIVQR